MYYTLGNKNCKNQCYFTKILSDSGIIIIVPVRSEFKARQTIFSCGNKLNVSISNLVNINGKEMRLGPFIEILLGCADILYFSINWNLVSSWLLCRDFSQSLWCQV
jgi:hypothetical protein